MTEAEMMELYQACLDKWGMRAQVKKAREELQELKDALADWLLYFSEDLPPTNLVNILEEVVDVELMLEQLKRYFVLRDHKEEYFEIRDQKIQRLIGLLGDSETWRKINGSTKKKEIKR